MRIRKIYLDMDGVIVDWVKYTTENLYNTTPNEILDRYPNSKKIEDWIKSAHGREVDPPIFDSPLAWKEMPLYPWSKELVSFLESTGAELFILSSPLDNLTAYEGKCLWILKHFPHLFKENLILCNRKELLAKPDTLLIDDMDENTSKFIEAGGPAYTFPRRWNSNTEFAGNPLLHTQNALRKYKFSSPTNMLGECINT